MRLTIVYIDTVFVLNSILDYLLLLSAAKLGAAPFQRFRVLLGAALGGLYASLVFLPSGSWLSHPLLRLLWAAGMALAAFGWKQNTPRLFLLFLAVSCALAGMLVMVSMLTRAEVTYPQGIAVTGIDWKALLLAGALCYTIASALLKRLTPDSGGELVEVKLRWDCRQVTLTALTDSGNLLTDPAGSGPVLVAYWKAAAPVLPVSPRIESRDVTDPVSGMMRLGAGWGRGRVHLLPYRGIGVSGGFLLAIRMDSGVIDGQVVHRQLVALAPEPLSDGQYQAVIGQRKGE